MWPYVFVAPAVVALSFGYLLPLASVVRNSLYTGSFFGLTFVGFQNYPNLFADATFRTSLLNNLRLLATVPIMTIAALLLAVMLADRVRAWRVYRSTIFLPYILPAVGIGIAFSAFLQFNGGLNQLLRSAGLDRLALDWLGSPDLAIWSVAGLVVWQQLGFGVVIFSAALLSLPREVTEAGRLDGCSWWQLQLRVHLPQIRGSIEFFLVTQAITVLSWVFAYVYVLTGGGPANSSSVMELCIWRNGFAGGSVGLASAAAVVLLLLAAILIVIYMQLRRIDESGEES